MTMTDNAIMAEDLEMDFESMFQEALGDEGPEIKVVVETPPPSLVVQDVQEKAPPLQRRGPMSAAAQQPALRRSRGPRV